MGMDYNKRTRKNIGVEEDMAFLALQKRKTPWLEVSAIKRKVTTSELLCEHKRISALKSLSGL